jgi:competence protein ComEA
VQSAAEETEKLPPTTIIVDIKGEVQEPGVYEVNFEARVNELIELAGGFTRNADPEQINLAQKLHDEMSIIVPKEGGANELEETGMSDTQGKLRLNHATQEEIETLPGIGPAKAQAIIQYREENGLFQDVQDLLNISGIGEKTLESFMDQIQVP